MQRLSGKWHSGLNGPFASSMDSVIAAMPIRSFLVADISFRSLSCAITAWIFTRTFFLLMAQCKASLCFACVRRLPVLLRMMVALSAIRVYVSVVLKTQNLVTRLGFIVPFNRWRTLGMAPITLAMAPTPPAMPPTTTTMVTIVSHVSHIRSTRESQLERLAHAVAYIGSAARRSCRI